MARNPVQTTPQRPKLNAIQIQSAIERLQRRINDVEELDPATLDVYDPRIASTQAGVDEALARAFGQGTVEYQRYRDTVDQAAEWPSLGVERQLAQFRDDVVRGKAKVFAMLRAAVNSLNEELDEMRAANPASATMGSTIFIGHGRSPIWRELKDFLKDRLSLNAVEFSSVATAGVATADRLAEMLNEAAFAFLLMTAEDELADGSKRARENVVHEVGLFQGRLGFKRAIVVLEEGCQEFSNITGLGQIRFPKGDISAKYEEIRRVLEREGLTRP